MRCLFPLTARLFRSELIVGLEQRCIKDTACKRPTKIANPTRSCKSCESWCDCIHT